MEKTQNNPAQQQPAPSVFRPVSQWLDRAQQKLPLTREGKYWLLFSLALLGTGLFRSINLINLLSSFLIATLFCNYWLARRQLRSLRGRRIGADVVFAGTKTPIVLEVFNPRSRSVQGLQIQQQGQLRNLSVLGRCQSAHVEVPLFFRRRGRQTLGALSVACGYPLGLAHCQRVLAAEEPIVVLPRLGSLRRGLLRRYLQQYSPTIGQARKFPRRHPSAQTDFHGMRNFLPGDSPRWIHWRTTAHRGELMVKEFEETPSDNLILIVDPYTAPRVTENAPEPKPHEDANLETLLSLAATICWEWCRQKGDHLVLGIAGKEPVVCGGVTSTDLAREQLRHLALEPGSTEPNVPGLLQKFADIQLPAAPVLVISTHACEFLEELQQGLHRTLAAIDVSLREHDEFFEM